jgi:hypothetical protein
MSEIDDRIQALEAEIARIKSPPLEPRPVGPRVLEGQGPLLIDAAGNRLAPPLREPASTTVGGGGFGATRPDGRYMPDGVERDSRTGEVLRHVGQTAPIPAGPSRTAQHQQAIDILDRAFPLQPHPVPDTGEA